MATRTKRRSSKPPGKAVLAAVTACRERFGGHDDVLSVCVGLKHARTCRENHGYGETPRACVKFVVDRKRMPRDVKRRLPKRVAVTHRGRRYMIPTDVEEVHLATPHGGQLAPELRVATRNIGVATPGMFVQDSEGTVYLLTAGHALVDDPSESPVDGERVVCAKDGEGSAEGYVVARASYFMSPWGDKFSLVDVGVVRFGFRPPGETPSVFRRSPWDVRSEVMEGATIKARIADGKMVTLTYRGLRNRGTAVIDRAGEDPAINDRPEVLANGRLYAPVIVHYRGIPVLPGEPESRFSEGDSGAALLNESGQWVGLHVVGLRGGGTEGWGQLGESVLRHVTARMGKVMRPIGVVG